MRKNVLCVSALLAVSFITQQASAQSWNVTGNAASSSNFLGTTNSVPLRLYTKGVERLRIDTLGNVGIGTTAPAAKLHIVDGVNTGGGYYKPLRIYNPNLLTGEHVQLAFGRASSSYNQGEVNFNLAGGVGSVNNTLSFGLYGNPTILTLQGTGSVGIGTAAPDGSAVLDMRSTTKGLLIPHMTTAQRNAITAPASGLLIYQTDGVPGFYYYNAGWLPLAGTSSSTGANTALSNLSATAINTDLLPGTNGTLNIGSASNSWNNIDYSGTIYKGGVSFISNNGTWNTFVGISSGVANTGSFNTGFGFYSINNNTSGSYNTAIGVQAMRYNTSGVENAAFGLNALAQNTTGIDNSATGVYALEYSNGDNNTADGAAALRNNSIGSYNVAQGRKALWSNNTGSYNVGIGDQALYNNVDNSYNTAVGDNAGFNNTSYSTFLGANAGGSNSDLTNVTAIGYNASVDVSNKVVIGNTSVTSIGGNVGWTNFSDGRYKKNIKEDVPGLEFISKLRPVTYNLDVDGIENAKVTRHPKTSIVSSMMNAGGTAQSRIASGNTNQTPSKEELAARQEKAKIVYTGFIAQEVEATAKKLNYKFSGVDAPKNANNFYGLRYSEFVVPLVKAVQELNKKTEKIDELEKQIQELKDIVAKLVNSQPVNKTVSVDNIYLEQNIPNPFNQTTSIKYSIPSGFSSAKILITDYSGRSIKEVDLTSTSGFINMDASFLSSGSYNYSLVIDGKITKTKKMVLAK